MRCRFGRNNWGECGGGASDLRRETWGERRADESRALAICQLRRALNSSVFRVHEDESRPGMSRRGRQAARPACICHRPFPPAWSRSSVAPNHSRRSLKMPDRTPHQALRAVLGADLGRPIANVRAVARPGKTCNLHGRGGAAPRTPVWCLLRRPRINVASAPSSWRRQGCRARKAFFAFFSFSQNRAACLRLPASRWIRVELE